MIRYSYRRWMLDWENRLAFRATNRVVRPFEWGLDWTRNWPAAAHLPQNGHTPHQYLCDLNQLILERSDEFFGYETPRNFHLDGDFLKFTFAPVATPSHPSNDIAHARWFPAAGSKKAVVVLPHWNATATQHEAHSGAEASPGWASRPFASAFPITTTACRPSYSAPTTPSPRTSPAPWTPHARRDRRMRRCLDWLQSQGDMSAWESSEPASVQAPAMPFWPAPMTSALLSVNVFNHCSTYFADVVWTGLSTQHIRQVIEGHIDLDKLREVWMAISPVNYMERFAGHKSKKSKFIYTTYDTTFLPELSIDTISRIRSHGIDHQVVVLPCGQYTMGETPLQNFSTDTTSARSSRSGSERPPILTQPLLTSLV